MRKKLYGKEMEFEILQSGAVLKQGDRFFNIEKDLDITKLDNFNKSIAVKDIGSYVVNLPNKLFIRPKLTKEIWFSFVNHHQMSLNQQDQKDRFLLFWIKSI